MMANRGCVERAFHQRVKGHEALRRCPVRSLKPEHRWTEESGPSEAKRCILLPHHRAAARPEIRCLPVLQGGGRVELTPGPNRSHPDMLIKLWPMLLQESLAPLGQKPTSISDTLLLLTSNSRIKSVPGSNTSAPSRSSQ
uniref:Uncharacterized protein n=1 Tax=Knipowitschia caucasica TaxID=637954 RepID=A0AAV2MJL8_KNICA